MRVGETPSWDIRVLSFELFVVVGIERNRVSGAAMAPNLKQGSFTFRGCAICAGNTDDSPAQSNAHRKHA